MSEVALVRVEELSPFPRKDLKEVLEKYDNAHIVWAQEEPETQGPWTYVRPRVEDLLRGLGRETFIRYAGRRTAATVATGVGAWHKAEVAEILKYALEV